MNSKKCKALRKALRAEIAARGLVVPARQLAYRDTQKQVGWVFPQGWLKENFIRLSLVGGHWFVEAINTAKRVYARQAVNTPGTQRYIYRKAKKKSPRGA